jgi:hypothetical protein
MRYVNLAFLENRVAKPGNYDVLKGVAKKGFPFCNDYES